MKILLSVLLSIVLFNHLVLAVDSPDDYKLELVQVLFRHGDRTPEKAEIYETDPYDKVFKSYGYGQLTKIGLQREYKIGQLLKERYGNFLGDFNNSDVYAYSTNSDRTKMSLQLVLTGLYPPKAETSWSNEINWQPIPTHYDTDEVNFLSSFSCPAYRKLVVQVIQSSEIQRKLEKYKNFFESLRNKTRISTLTPIVVHLIYNNIRAAESFGLPRPDWCTEEDLKNIQEISHIALQALTHTKAMTRMTGGSMIEKFLENLKNEDGKKIYLYGAHDLNIVTFTNAHRFTGIPEIPDYGSTIIFEKLRGKDNQIYIRMFLWTGVSEKLIPLKVDKCGQTCLLSDYKNIVKSLLPDDFARQCISRRNLCKSPRSSTHKMDLSLQLSYLFAGKDLPSFKYMKDFVLLSI